MRTRLLAAFVACCVSQAGITAPGPKEPGQTYRTVTVAMVVPQPCVSVQMRNARILLPRDKLVELSHNPGPSYRSEEERLAYLTGRRAASLLAMTTRELDASGCAVVDLSDAAEVRDAIYLVGQLIENGLATVIRTGSTKAETRVTVHEYNTEIFGMESFEFIGGEAFLGYPTWAS